MPFLFRLHILMAFELENLLLVFRTTTTTLDEFGVFKDVICPSNRLAEMPYFILKATPLGCHTLEFCSRQLRAPVGFKDITQPRTF